jgi:hypothetical protein
MKPMSEIIKPEDLTQSGENVFWGIEASIPKFLFLKKKVFALASEQKGGLAEAFTQLVPQLDKKVRYKATYRCFRVVVKVYGWDCGKPLAEYGEPSYWKKWDAQTLLEKAKNW